MASRRISLYFPPSGGMTMIYDDDLSPALAGGRPADVQRVSHIEPTANLSATAVRALVIPDPGRRSTAELRRMLPRGFWADLTPVDGPVLGPYARRREALEAELAWLRDNPAAWADTTRRRDAPMNRAAP